MAVVKADGYGHGAVAVGKRGADRGSVLAGRGLVDEALALRAAGIQARIFCWLHTVGRTTSARRWRRGSNLSVSSLRQLWA